MFIGSGEFYWGVGSSTQTGPVTGTTPANSSEPARFHQFYGADENNFSRAIPINLTAYQNVDGTAVLYWSFDPVAGVLYDNIVWTVQTDLVNTFDSPDLATYTTNANPDYIDGHVNKGLIVPLYQRAQGEERTMYWRVKGDLLDVGTPYVVSTFTIASAIDQVAKQAMLDMLPDIIYKKDLTHGETNLSRLYHSLGSELDILHMDGVLVDNDGFTASVRDASLSKNFGSLLQVGQPATMDTIDFREIVRTLMREAGLSPSIGSIRRMARAIFGTDPDFTLIRNNIEMYVNDPASVPPVDPFYVDDPAEALDPATLWGNAELSFGVIIHINNPLSVPVSRAFVESILLKLTPAFAPVYITGV